MKDYIKRLFEEKNEVSERLQKLRKFLSVEKIPLTEKQRELLEKQASIMSEYESVLHERILLENDLENHDKNLYRYRAHALHLQMFQQGNNTID